MIDIKNDIRKAKTLRNDKEVFARVCPPPVPRLEPLRVVYKDRPTLRKNRMGIIHKPIPNKNDIILDITIGILVITLIASLIFCALC